MTLIQNDPSLWRHKLPQILPDGHKYDRGCVVMFGGDKMTGAARLAAEAAMRTGAGLCIVVASAGSADIYRTMLPAHIIVEDFTATADHLADTRRNAVVIGPGAGQGADLADKVLDILAMNRPTVLDADALTVFAKDPSRLLKALHPTCVLTPHMGEFTRIFSGLENKSSVEKAVKAAALAKCTILLKGQDCAVAAPDHDPVSHRDVAPYLATAGSGDVLAGMIAALMAQGMAPFDAACAGAWLHRAAGRLGGRGMVASDIPALIPVAWDALDGV